MKNQYFGDRNDFFKYDVILKLLEANSELKNFTYVPMLTPSDSSNDGNITQYDGSRRPYLKQFLDKARRENRKDIRTIIEFMKQQGYITYIHMEDEYYFYNQRERYFKGLYPEFLSNSVILADPDNGFEVASMKSENASRYLKYSDMSKLYEKMSTNSILSIYQHLPRKNRQEYFDEVCKEIRSYTENCGLIVLSNNIISFFLLFKDNRLLNSTLFELKKYYDSERFIRYKYCSTDNEEKVPIAVAVSAKTPKSDYVENTTVTIAVPMKKHGVRLTHRKIGSKFYTTNNQHLNNQKVEYVSFWQYILTTDNFISRIIKIFKR